MSSASITVRYDGPALAGHQMDVADLAPALLGISELCKIANRRFNAERAVMKVFIGTDAEHQCFQFRLDVVQTLWQQAQAVIAHHDIKSAKEILEWIGLIGGPAFGLFKLLKWIGKREITKTQLEVKDGRDVIQINVEGEGNNVIIAYRETYEMLQDFGAIANAKKVIEPLTKDGYEQVEFESNSVVTEKITKQEAEVIAELGSVVTIEVDAEKPQTITAWIQVYAPVYDMIANKWQFRLGDKHEYMDISETDIAKRAIERGGALIDDTYKVILEIQQVKTPTGRFTMKYKIKKVLEFHPAKIKTQADWLNGA